ncbi:MAG: glycerol-3-phosphate acyltransferase [Chloroflexi bacterium]|nr:glycerol-3-phosphate acyltransferase [Chloroflexota bacterium]
MFALILVISAYLVGSIPFGYLAGKLLKGMDIRDYGTGNLGAANVWHNVGRLPAIGVGLADIGKGAWPVLVARHAGGGDYLTAAAGLAAIIGYDWPIFLKFSGGRGMATTIGVLLACLPLKVLPLILVFALGLLLNRLALFMFLGMGSFPMFLWWTGEGQAIILLVIAAFVLMIIRRLEGIQPELQLPADRKGVILNRLLHDRRPRQRLAGRRERSDRD